MPMIELSDDDAALLELAKQVGGTQGINIMARAKTLHDNLLTSKHSLTYQDAIKELYPNAKVPKDAHQPELERLDNGLKKIDEWLEARNKEREDETAAKSQADFNASFDAVVKEYGLTEEGEKALVEFMQKRKLADPDAAAALYFKQNPKPTEPTPVTGLSPRNWARDFGIAHDESDVDAKHLISNPEDWAEKEAAAVLGEVRREQGIAA